MITTPRNSFFVDLLMIVVGILLLVFRNEIGSFTGYIGRGRYIDKPTPGWLLIPFALAFIAGGVILLLRNIAGQ